MADELDRGQAGASAEREYQRRKSNREARTRARHPWIGGLLLAFGGEPWHESAFRLGADGERLAADWLERHTRSRPSELLCDRAMPGGWGNIDLLAVARSGVFVIDVKAHSRRVAIDKHLFATPSLSIGGRDQTKLLDGLDRQVEAVRAVLARDGIQTALQGVLCFTSAELPRLHTLQLRGHLLLPLRPLAKRLNAAGPLDVAAIDALARTLATAFPPA